MNPNSIRHDTHIPKPTSQALIPEPDLSSILTAERSSENGRKAAYVDQGSIPLLNSVLWSGLLTAASLALHNFPGWWCERRQCVHCRLLSNALLAVAQGTCTQSYDKSTDNMTEGIALSVAATQGLRFSLPLTVAIAMYVIDQSIRGPSMPVP